jgi:hypothetical protein
MSSSKITAKRTDAWLKRLWQYEQATDIALEAFGQIIETLNPYTVPIAVKALAKMNKLLYAGKKRNRKAR